MSDLFKSKINSEIKPWVENNCIDGFFPSFDGLDIHYYYAINEKRKGSIVMVHGFCEFFAKYHELAYYLYQAGYSIFFLELRGHGKSGSENKKFDDHRVSVKSFGHYVSDLRIFIDDVVIPKSNHDNLYLYCHSMGGTVGAEFIAFYPKVFKAAVLSSPMLEVNYGSVPLIGVQFLALYSKIACLDEEYAPGQHSFDGVYNFENSSCDDEDRYKYQFDWRLKDEDYQMYGGSWSWVRSAGMASFEATISAKDNVVPTLICKAKNDTTVKISGIDYYNDLCLASSLVEYNSKHEIYNSTDDIFKKYVDDILVYYGAH